METTQKFMIRFSGWKVGWTGPTTIYTITTEGKTQQDAVLALAATHTVDKVLAARQVKGKK